MTTATFHPNTGPQSPAAIEEAHPCAAYDCSALCSPGHVACRRHWCAIPQELRDPLIEAFKRRLGDPVGYRVAQADAQLLVRRYAHRV